MNFFGSSAEKRTNWRTFLSNICKSTVSWHTLWILFLLGVYIAGAYFGLSSETSRSANLFRHFAILVFDVLVLAQIIVVIRGGDARRDLRGVIITATSTCLLLFCAFLHGDYLYNRLHWREAGVFGSLGEIQEALILNLAALNALLIGQISVTSSLRPQRKSDAEPLVLGRSLIVAFACLISTPIVGYFLINVGAFTSPYDVLLYALSYVILPFFLLVTFASLSKEGIVPFWVPAAIAAALFVHFCLPSLNAYLKISSGDEPLVHIAMVLCGSIFLSLLAWKEGKLFVVLSFSYLLGTIVLTAFEERERIDAALVVTEPGAVENFKKGYLPEVARRKPNVYFLVYDGYPNPSLFHHYGFENDEQMKFLESEGFTIYPHTYSQYLATIGSISRVLDMDTSPRRPIVGSNTVNTHFRDIGYETNLVVHPYYYQETQDIGVDNIFPPPSKASRIKTVLKGIAAGEFKSEFVFSHYTRDEWLTAKREVFTRQSAKPKFLYAHSGVPGHSQNSGKCLENEKELFVKKLAEANAEMREDIRAIKDREDDAIIIVASDHGPYLEGDCLYLSNANEPVSAIDLLDRYGVFLGIHWPEGSPSSGDSPRILQDVFFNVFSYIHEDPSILDHRLPRVTFGYGPVLKDGFVKDGKIAFGAYKDSPLFNQKLE